MPIIKLPEGLRSRVVWDEGASLHAFLRENWLNPADRIGRGPEVAPGNRDRIMPRNPKAAATLKKRAPTNLYNERPAWLDHEHRDLDPAVAAAHGWPADI